MRKTSLRSFLLFSGGAAVAALAIQWGSARSVDAARYEDLDLFTVALPDVLQLTS